MRFPNLHPAAVLMATLSLACGGDSTGTNGGAIDEATAGMVADEVFSAVFSALNAPSGSPSMAAPVAINVQYTNRHYCDAGGYIDVSGSLTGSFDSETGSGSAWLQVLETLTDCTFDVNGTAWILNGDPYLSATGSFTWLNGLPATQQSISIGGAIDYNGNFCAVNLSILYSTGGQGTTTYSGTVCGYSINGSV